MSNTTLIAVVAASAGVGYILYKRSQKPVVATPDDACKKLCVLVPDPTYRAECEAACNAAQLISQVASAVSPFHDSTEQWSHEVYRRENINNKLNGGKSTGKQNSAGDEYGPPDGSMVVFAAEGTDFGTGAPGAVLVGNIAKYPNGCEPYYAAPGWSKCAPGTLDMYQSAVDADASKNYGFTESSLMTPVPSYTYRAQQVFRQIVKDNFGTGGPGDPLTYGPMKDLDCQIDPQNGRKYGCVENGKYAWIVRGLPIAGADPSLVPRAIVMQNQTRAGESEKDLSARIAALTDAQAMELINPYADSNVVSTHYDCSNIPSSMTYDAAIKGWRRRRAGEQQVMSPECTASGGAPTSGSPSRASQFIGVSSGAPRVIEHI